MFLQSLPLFKYPRTPHLEGSRLQEGDDGSDQMPLKKLGGQYVDYLEHALQAYRHGDRQHALMSPQAADLSDQDIADLAAYFSSRPSQLRDLHGL